METPTSSLFNRMSNSIAAKSITIFLLILLLLIPLHRVTELIEERQNRQSSVSQEIAFKWAGQQVIAGPIIAIPYQELQEVVTEKKTEMIAFTKYLYLLPKTATIKSNISPKPLQRGIYKSVVYQAELALKGSFETIDFEKVDVTAANLEWNKAAILIGLSDLKGLGASPTLLFNQKKIEFEPNKSALNPFENNMIAPIDLSGTKTTVADFEIQFNLRGSQSINFLPLAKQTTIQAKGTWANPSFNGAVLADDRKITHNSFEATWNIPNFNRKLPQQWTGNKEKIYVIAHNYKIEQAFSDDYNETSVEISDTNHMVANEKDMVQINFLEEVNNYQKTTRVAKYGFLIIILTFAALFFTEIIKKQKIHLIQYLLIGFAMVLFYTLLLAISETLGFNIAYLLASIATIFLIASFIKMITKNKKSALIFSVILGIFYSFIFILMQLRDFSLIVGTVGVFIILAILMRLSTKINWYQIDQQ